MKPKKVGYISWNKKKGETREINGPLDGINELALTAADRAAGFVQQAVYIDEDEVPK